MNTTSHGITNYFLLRHRQHAGIAALAGLLPDVPYVLAGVWGVIVHGFTMRAVLEIWSHPIANFAAQRVLQSIVLASALSLVALATKWARLRAFAAGWALHVWTDHWLHARDSYPTLWPFSRRVFPSPFSYWDWDYHGRWVGLSLSLWAIGLWSWLVWRIVGADLARAKLRTLFAEGRPGVFARWALAVAGVLLALSSGLGVYSSLSGRFGASTPAPRSWVDEGFSCWPAPVAPAVEKLRDGDPAGALGILESLPKGADAERCPGAPPWDVPVEGARIALLSGYAHDLAGRRDAALWEYRKAERLETVGSLGDKARRYQGEVFRNEPDPFVTPEWVALFVWGLALCVVMIRSVPRTGSYRGDSHQPTS